MRMKHLGMILLLALALLCVGCSSKPAEEASTQAPSEEAKSFTINETEAVKAIKERGYMLVGCKNDVPGFGYYNEETGAYEGGEIELAYHIAAKIFGVSYEEAAAQELVQFQTVAVADREKVLQEGTVDYVIATYTVTEERGKLVDFSNSYYTSAVGLMIQNKGLDDSSLGQEEIRSIHDLDGKIIGVSTGSTTRADMMSYCEKNMINITPRFVEYSDYDSMSTALDEGNIDVFCVDTTILKGYLEGTREILADRFAAQKYAVASGKEAAGLADVANAVIEELDYNGIVLFE